MKWNVKKVLGLTGIAFCVLLLILVGISAITWRLFWILIILVAGFAYLVLPKLRD